MNRLIDEYDKINYWIRLIRTIARNKHIILHINKRDEFIKYYTLNLIITHHYYSPASNLHLAVFQRVSSRAIDNLILLAG